MLYIIDISYVSLQRELSHQLPCQVFGCSDRSVNCVKELWVELRIDCLSFHGSHLLRGEIGCSESLTPAIFDLSFSASFSAFFFSNSSCLRFSSFARWNILTKFNKVDTTATKESNAKERIY